MMRAPVYPNRITQWLYLIYIAIVHCQRYIHTHIPKGFLSDNDPRADGTLSTPTSVGNTKLMRILLLLWCVCATIVRGAAGASRLEFTRSYLEISRVLIPGIIRLDLPLSISFSRIFTINSVIVVVVFSVTLFLSVTVHTYIQRIQRRKRI